LIAGGIGVVALGCFFVVESRSSAPMLPLDLFRSRSFRGANLMTLFLYGALGGVLFFLPLDLIQVQHYSATATGAAALPLILLMFLLSRWSGGLVDRFGAKGPLMVGPVIAAAGFLLFVIPSVGGSYWTTFFPGFVVLGLGMAVSVAPLTTVVMGAVERNHAGTASGINNAVARIAGLLAIAILGMVMVGAFRDHMNQSLTQLNMPFDVIQSVQSSATRLAAIAVPAGIDSSAAAEVRVSIDRAFVFGFRLIMLICAGLSAASSGFAWRMIAVNTKRDLV